MIKIYDASRWKRIKKQSRDFERNSAINKKKNFFRGHRQDRDAQVNSRSLVHSLHTATLMDEHVTQGRTITLLPHTPLETPPRPFSDWWNSGTCHFTVTNQSASTPVKSRVRHCLSTIEHIIDLDFRSIVNRCFIDAQLFGDRRGINYNNQKQIISFVSWDSQQRLSWNSNKTRKATR